MGGFSLYEVPRSTLNTGTLVSLAGKVGARKEHDLGGPISRGWGVEEAEPSPHSCLHFSRSQLEGSPFLTGNTASWGYGIVEH